MRALPGFFTLPLSIAQGWDLLREVLGPNPLLIFKGAALRESEASAHRKNSGNIALLSCFHMLRGFMATGHALEADL